MAAPTPPAKGTLAQRAARDPALLKKVLANPGLRYKLPSSMLSVAQQRVRKAALDSKAKAQGEAAFSDPTTPISGVNLIGAAKSITDQAYDPQLAEVTRQSAVAKKQGAQAQGAVGSMYDTIAKYQTAALNQQNTQQAAGAQSVAGIFNGAAGQVDAAAQQQRDQAARDAQVRGGGLDGGSLADLASRVATAKDNIAQRGQIAGDNLAANAQTNNAVLGGIGAATQQHRGEQQDAIGNQTRSKLDTLAGQRSTLEGARGSDFVKQILGLRTQAANEYITESGLGIKKEVAAQASTDKAAQRKTTTANQAANRAAQEKRWGRTVNKYGVTNAAWYQWGKTDAGKAKRAEAMKAAKASGKTAAGAKGKSPFVPPATQASAKDTIDRTRALVEQYRKAGVPDTKIRQVLKLGQAGDKKAGTPAVKAVPNDFINAAFDLAELGGLSPANVAALHKRGLKIKSLGYKPLNKTDTAVDNVASQVDQAIPGRLLGG